MVMINEMIKLTHIESNKKEVKNYLQTLFKEPIKLSKISKIGQTNMSTDFKGFGYGAPYLIEFAKNGQHHKIVLSTMKGDEFGHEFSWDRAHSLLMAHSTFNKMPQHVESLDVGFFGDDGSITSTGHFQEMFQVTEFIEGTEYWRDLERITNTNRLPKLDLQRCKALAHYLSNIHSKKCNTPSLYTRRIRELLSHGECIMGIIDSYPPDSSISKRDLQRIEQKCLDWRWILKERCYRLSQVHGDFHPWNILFLKGVNFMVLDRSRGEWGEPADDLAALTINYIFFSLRKYGHLEESFKELLTSFISTYINKSKDEELFKIIQPFYAWRVLVLANPIWYPNLTDSLRKRLIQFIFDILDLPEVGIDELVLLAS